MVRRTPLSTRTNILFPDTTLCRSCLGQACPSFPRRPLSSSSPAFVPDRFDDDEGLRPGMIVGQREVDMRAVPRRDHLREPRRGAAGQREGGSAGGGVDDADVLHEDAAFEAGRSEERRVGKEFVSTFISRWSPYQ